MVEAHLVRGLVEEREHQLNKKQESVRSWAVNAKLRQIERAIVKKAANAGLSIELALHLTIFFVDVTLTLAELALVFGTLISKGYKVTADHSLRISWYKPCSR